MANGGSIRGINAKGLATLTRKQIDALGEFVKGYGVKGLAWVALKAEGNTSSAKTFAKTLKSVPLTASEISLIFKSNLVSGLSLQFLRQ